MACTSNINATVDPKIQFSINLVRDKEDVEEQNTYFAPGLVPEIIEDYNGDTKADIRLSFWSSSLKTLITSNVDGNELIHNIIMDLKKDLSVNYYNQVREFLALYDEEFSTDFIPHGKMINSFNREVNGKVRHFEIYFNDFEDDNQSFKDYHRRMESFALLYIDGARRITVDPMWCCFTVFEVEPKKLRYHFIGYSTVYRFRLIPDKIRPRISQFFIVPPYQRLGIGKHLLRMEQNYLIESFNILEITVEEPCDAFQEMRDIVDAERILTSMPSLIPEIMDSRPSTKKFVVTELQKRLFIPKKRVHHMNEIVKLYCILKKDRGKIGDFQKEIGERIKTRRMNEQNIVGPKQRRQGLRPLKDAFQIRPEDSVAIIEEEFKDLFKKYETVVKKLEVADPDWSVQTKL